MDINRELELIVEQVEQRHSSEFTGELTIHFNQGVPTQIECRECMKFKRLKEARRAASG